VELELEWVGWSLWFARIDWSFSDRREHGFAPDPVFCLPAAEWLGYRSALSSGWSLILGARTPHCGAGYPRSSRIHVDNGPILLESLVFILVGLELRDVVSSLQLHALRRLTDTLW